MMYMYYIYTMYLISILKNVMNMLAPLIGFKIKNYTNLVIPDRSIYGAIYQWHSRYRMMQLIILYTHVHH